MYRLLHQLLIPVLILATGFATAQQESPESVESEPVQILPEPMMSPIEDAVADESTTLASSNDKAAPVSATMMPPGICLVVDELVREFCNANPGDISSQFQQQH